MLFVYSALVLAFVGYANACSCPQFFGQDHLAKDPVYNVCKNYYLTRVKLSKLENYTCVQDPARNFGCLMKAEVIEDFFGPLKETERKPIASIDAFKGDLNGPLCGVSLPKPGDYITNAFPDFEFDALRENACHVYREPYTEKLAAEIRATVKKCPKERLSFAYWEEKGLKLAMSDRVQPTTTK